jgi:hypothetical protein
LIDISGEATIEVSLRLPKLSCSHQLSSTNPFPPCEAMISASSTTSNQLLVLSALGGFLLWGVMMFNGTLDALELAQQTGTLPGDRSLRMVYTGSKVIDSNLRILVAFFDVMTNADAGASRWLLFSNAIVCRTLNAWVFIESRRRGINHPWLRQ